MVLGFGKLKVVIYLDNLRGSCVFRAETVTSAYDKRGVLFAVETILDIKIKRLAVGSRFFCAVKHSDAFGCGRNRSEEMLR